jgi:hypothetical protein
MRMAPAPIATAPEGHNPPVLLFCPDQGGWHAGIWFYGKWLAAIDTSTILNPTHWLPSPPEPEEGDSTAA